jgi:hypothetical protein
MKRQTTNRGFALYEFADGNGEPCSLQESSTAERDCIWLGCDRSPPPHHVTGEELSPRMHLTREQVAELIPLLQHFVDDGMLPEGDEP